MTFWNFNCPVPSKKETNKEMETQIEELKMYLMDRGYRETGDLDYAYFLSEFFSHMHSRDY